MLTAGPGRRVHAAITCKTAVDKHGSIRPLQPEASQLPGVSLAHPFRGLSDSLVLLGFPLSSFSPYLSTVALSSRLCSLWILVRRGGLIGIALPGDSITRRTHRLHVQPCCAHRSHLLHFLLKIPSHMKWFLSHQATFEGLKMARGNWLHRPRNLILLFI